MPVGIYGIFQHALGCVVPVNVDEVVLGVTGTEVITREALVLAYLTLGGPFGDPCVVSLLYFSEIHLVVGWFIATIPSIHVIEVRLRVGQQVLGYPLRCVTDVSADLEKGQFFVGVEVHQGEHGEVLPCRLLEPVREVVGHSEIITKVGCLCSERSSGV